MIEIIAETISLLSDYMIYKMNIYNYFDNLLIISAIFHAKMIHFLGPKLSNIKELLHNSKLNMSLLWTVGWTKQLKDITLGCERF